MGRLGRKEAAGSDTDMANKTLLLPRTETAFQHSGGRIAAAIRDIQGKSSHQATFSNSTSSSPSFSPLTPRGSTWTSVAHSTPIPESLASPKSYGKINIASRLELLKNKYFTEESPIGQGRDSLIKRGSRINNNVASSDSSEEEEEEDADEC